MLKIIFVHYFQELIRSVTAKEHAEYLIKEKIIQFQAYIRGYLLRKKISDRLTYFHNNVDKIIRIQAWWRSIVQRKRYVKLLEDKKKAFQNTYIKVKPNYTNILDYYREYVSNTFPFYFNFSYNTVRVVLIYL